MDRQIGFDQISRNQVEHSKRADQFDKLPADQQAKQIQLSSTIIRTFAYGSPALFLFYYLITTVALWATFKIAAGAETSFKVAYAIVMYASLPGIVGALLGIISMFAGVSPDGFDINNPVGTNLAYYLDPASTGKFPLQSGLCRGCDLHLEHCAHGHRLLLHQPSEALDRHHHRGRVVPGVQVGGRVYRSRVFLAVRQGRQAPRVPGRVMMVLPKKCPPQGGSMKRVFAFFMLFAATAVLAQEKNPVTSVVKEILPRRQKNLVAAVEEMPADKFSYRPTEAQMTFGHLVLHILESNNFLCSKIGDVAEVERDGAEGYRMERQSWWPR